MKISKKKILKIQRNRYPFLMVDKVLNVTPGKKIHAQKNLSNKDSKWFFDIHWPDDPNMPGVLQLESMSQACAIAIQVMKKYNNKILYVINVKSANFKRKVLPKGNLDIFGEITKFKRGIANCTA